MQIVKVDTDTGEVLTWKDKNNYPSEPVFISRPGAVVRLIFYLIDELKYIMLYSTLSCFIRKHTFRTILKEYDNNFESFQQTSSK